MRVTHLSLRDFRNYAGAEVGFEPGLNLVIGRNGQGKTNLVEAVAYFASLGSHRVSGDAALIRAGHDSAIARMRIAAREREVLLEVQLNRGSPNRAQVNRNTSRPRELPRWFSTVVFAPEDLSIVRGEPSRRRAFLDEAITLRNPAFLATLSDYERVVRQRTALLKSARASGSRSALDATLDVWDAQLIELGVRIMMSRRRLIADLAGPLREGYRSLVHEDHSPTLSLHESLTSTLERSGGTRESLADGNRPSTMPDVPIEGAAEDVPRETSLGGAEPSSGDRGEGGAASSGSAASHLQAIHSLSGGAVSRETSLGRDGGGAYTRISESGSSPLNITPSNGADVSRETLEEEYRRALAAVRRLEFDRAMTLVGPHRDDLLLELNGLPVKGYASHGESWSFALGLRLALAQLLREGSPAGDPVLILDDVFAELDARRRSRLLSAVRDFEQVIVTAAVEEDLPEDADWHWIRISNGQLVPGEDS